MFTHAFALGVSLVAIYLASSAPGHRRTFGLFRAEVLASLFNSLFLFVVTGLIVYESVMRFLDPTPVHSGEMFLIAVIGLVVNLVSMWILRAADKGDRNIRSAVVHMAADALSSVAVVAGAIVIRTTGFTYVDPALGIGISLLILVWGWNLLRDAVRVLLEIAPKGMSTDRITRLLRENDARIVDVPDMHVIEITSGMYDLSAHVEVEREALPESQDVIDRVNKLLGAKLNIYHTTIQVGTPAVNTH
jgi:cobalt-zinc-cadmium efflux system protein